MARAAREASSPRNSIRATSETDTVSREPYKTYPEQARRQGIEGSVTLRFSVDRGGHVVDVTVLRGSGSPILDSAAEAMLRNAMLPPPAPATQDRMAVSVQIHYKLAD